MSEIVGDIGKAVGAGVKAVGAGVRLGIRSSPAGFAEAGRLAISRIESPSLRRVDARSNITTQAARSEAPASLGVNERIGAIRKELAMHEVEDLPPRIIVVEKEDEENGFLSAILLFIARAMLAVFRGGKEITELGVDITQDPLAQEAVKPNLYDIKPRISF